MMNDIAKKRIANIEARNGKQAADAVRRGYQTDPIVRALLGRPRCSVDGGALRPDGTCSICDWAARGGR